MKDSKSRKTKGLKEYERVDNTSEKAPDDEDTVLDGSLRANTTRSDTVWIAMVEPQNYFKAIEFLGALRSLM